MKSTSSGKKCARRTVTVGIRASSETREQLGRLVDTMSDTLGTRVTISQAFAVAVKEALAKRQVALP